MPCNTRPCSRPLGLSRVGWFVLLTTLFAAASPSRIIAADYDITAFGAIANDGVNDLAAIQAAISAASPGDRIIIPAGTFHVSDSIRPIGDIAIVGAGRDNTVIRHTGTTSADGLVRLHATGVNNVELAGFTLDGQNSLLVQQGMVIGGTGGHHIHDLRIQNLTGNTFGSAGIYASFDADNNLIENNEFINIGVTREFGSGIRFDHGSEGNLVIGNTITNTGRGGIFFSNGSTDSVIRNNTITGSGLTAEGLGIEVWGGSHRSVIENNTLDHWLSIDRSNQVAVRNNTITATDGTLKFLGIEVAGGSDIVIQGNDVGAGNEIGLSLSNNTAKERIYVANNTFSESTIWGAQLQDGSNGTGEVRQLYFYNNRFEQTVADPLSGYYPPGVGFRFNALDNGGGIRQIVFDGNQFINNDDAGIQIYTDFGTIDKISFVGNTLSVNGDSAFIDVLTFDNLEWDSSNVVVGNAEDNTPTASASASGFADNEKPSLLQIVAPSKVVVGDAVSFAFLYADDGDPLPAQVLWDLGEGLPTTELAPIHTFSELGFYNIALVAWDAEGRAVHNVVTIEVAAHMPEPSTLVLLVLGGLSLLPLRRKTMVS